VVSVGKAITDVPLSDESEESGDQTKAVAVLSCALIVLVVPIQSSILEADKVN
jgi:hypothetical protein